MARQILTNENWSKLKSILLAEKIYDKSGLRMTVEGMLYHMRTGCPWRDLPDAFGPWNAIYKRFRAWCQSGKWRRMFETLVRDPDLEWVFIDGTYAKAHQHSAGAVGSASQAIGTSRAGQTTKVHMAVGAYGLPVKFEVTGGQVADCSVAPELIAQLPEAEAIVGDKGYDSGSIRQQIEAQGAQTLVPRRRNSVRGNDDLDRGLYRYRHLVENAFARLKQYRALAFRFDKLKNITRVSFYGLCDPIVTNVKRQQALVKRLGEPEEIAGAARYLAAPISSWMSRQTTFVNSEGVRTLD